MTSWKCILLGWDKCLGDVHYLNRESMLNKQSLDIIFLGPSKTGKSKLLNNFDCKDHVRRFPSEPNVLEEGKCNFQRLGSSATVNVYATPDSTIDRLLTSYLNTCSIVLLTYDVSDISHLRHLEKKYVSILKSHRDCDKLTVFLVGSRMSTTPTPSMLQDVSKTITLMLVTHSIRSQVGARVGTLEVTVDDFSSVEQFKERVLSFVILE
jgi:hypothetical protein